jgi:homoserine kinase
MALPVTHVHVRVPATSANLGPGFDTLGLALARYDELEVSVRDEPGAFVEVIGVGVGEVPTDETNLIVRSCAYAFEKLGQKMPGLHLRAHNNIAHGRGMGSSGAAIVGGIMAAKGLLSGTVEVSDETVTSLGVGEEPREGGLHTRPYVHEGIAPQPVDELVLPVVFPYCEYDRRIGANQAGLDAG